MTIKECYEQIGADYEDVRSRLRSDLLIRKFFLKFPDDKSFGQLKEALKSGDREGAFRGAHTLRGWRRIWDLFRFMRRRTVLQRICVLREKERL